MIGSSLSLFMTIGPSFFWTVSTIGSWPLLHVFLSMVVQTSSVREPSPPQVGPSISL